MSENQRGSSDPLPFTQIDRAVKSKASLLASILGVTNQHALGALVEFWDLCGDPRDLESIIQNTPAGETPMVSLNASDVSVRFQIASGKEISPEKLVHLGLLEKIDIDLYRVRGMSRFFEPIRRRIEVRTRASTAGKASAEARKAKFGTAKPAQGCSETCSGDVRTDPEQPPNKIDFRSRDVHEMFEQPLNSPEPIGQRTEDISFKEGSKPFVLTPPDQLVLLKPKRQKKSDPEDIFRDWVALMSPDEKRVFEQYEVSTGLRLWRDDKLLTFVKGVLRTHPLEEILNAIKGHASDPWNKAKKNLGLRAMLADTTKIALSAQIAVAQ